MEYSYLVLIPLIAGIGETLRRVGIPCRYIPFINLIMGLIMGIILCYSNSKVCIVDGLYIGLSASGLVKSSKTAYNCFQERNKCNNNLNNCDKKTNKERYNEPDEDCCDDDTHRYCKDEFEDDDNRC